MNTFIDHIVIGTADLTLGTKILETKLGVKFCPGGNHKLMGTHNKLLKLQSNIYLELISNNPNFDKPSRERWFSLDQAYIKKKILKSPRALCWVLKVDNIDDAAKKCGYDPGEILRLSRDELTWKVTVPSDGRLIENGVLPVLIEWPNNQHPSLNLDDSNVLINRISLFHPEPDKIKRIIFNLIESDLISISKGLPKIEVTLMTRNEKIVID